MTPPSETPTAKKRGRATRAVTKPTEAPAPRTGPGRRAGAYTQTERVLELLARLQARRTPALLASLAADLGISVKQLRRDLAVLHAAGHGVSLAPVEGRAAVRLVRGRSEAVTLTLRERFALLAMRDVLATLEGTPLAEDAASIFRKIGASLPDDAARDLRTLGPSFRYLPDGGLKRYDAHADVLDALLTGALHRHAVRARYRHAAGAIDTGTLEPWGIALYRNGLYVIGRWETATTPRVFAIERFEAATRARDKRFDVPADFSIDVLLRRRLRRLRGRYTAQGDAGVRRGRARHRRRAAISPLAAHAPHRRRADPHDAHPRDEPRGRLLARRLGPEGARRQPRRSRGSRRSGTPRGARGVRRRGEGRESEQGWRGGVGE